MRFLLSTLFPAALASFASAQIGSYGQDFEGLDMSSPSALADDGWLVFGNAFDAGGGYLYGYGPFPAPNGGPGFCAIASGEGGPPQGAQQLVVYSDYNNMDQSCCFIEGNTFQERIIDASDVGKTYVFTFDAKLGDIQPDSTAAGFIKILDPDMGFALTVFETQDTTSIPTTWSTYSLSTTIDASQVGDIFQIGFLATATNFTPSGVVYDNILLGEGRPGGEPGTATCFGESCPCDNDDPQAGCANSTGAGATLSGSGSASAAADDLVLTASGMPANQFAILFRAGGSFDPPLPFGDGLLCLAPPFCRANVAPTDDAGSASFGPGFVAQSQIGPPFCRIDAGDSWNFQVWYRDPGGPCGSGFNSTNAYTVEFAD